MLGGARSLTVEAPPQRRVLAEFLGSAFLAAAVIGSGVAAAQLSPGDVGLQLFENAAATAAGLFTFILMFGAVSGAHFNPVVSLVDAAFGGLRWRHAIAYYIPAQVGGCIAGAVAANAMFALPAVSISTHHRASPAHLFAEVIATLGLLLVIFALARTRRGNIAPAAVGAYIGAAYFFTSSTSFANPAIDIGRMFSDTFAGIAPASVPAFIVFQLVGAAVAVVAIRALYPDITPEEASEVMLPHQDAGAAAPASSVAELRRQLGHPPLDLVASRADLRRRAALGVGQVPVDVALAGDVGALVAAAHRHHDVGPLGVLAAELVRDPAGEVDAQFGHRLDHLGVDAVARRRPGRARFVTAGGDAFEQRLAHLRAAGVVQADEERASHRRELYGCAAEDRYDPVTSVSMNLILRNLAPISQYQR